MSKTLRQILAKNLEIPDRLLVSEWADKYRIVSSSSSPIPGPWRTDLVPYLREPMNCISDVPPFHLVREVYWRKPHQVGYTEGMLNNAIGYVMACAPGPAVLVHSSDKALRRYMLQKLDPMLRDTPALRNIIIENRSPYSKSTLQQKDFPGGFLSPASAHTSADLASTSARYLFAEEIAKYPPSIDGEGSPLEQAMARTSAYGNRRFIMAGSTPTVLQVCEITKRFLTGDQRHYHVACPHCGHRQPLELERLEWAENDYKAVTYKCISCKASITESHKTKMLAGGIWVPHHDNKDPSIRSYQLNSLYSPMGFLSWASVAKASDKAKNDPFYAITFQNLFAGLPSTDVTDETPSPMVLHQKRKHFDRGVLPCNFGIKPQFCTMSVDVQKDRLEALVVAWHKDQMYVIDHHVIHGNTEVGPDKSPWCELELLTQSKIKDEDGKEYPIHIVAIDGGYVPHRVFAFARRHTRGALRVVKGSATCELVVGPPKYMELRGKHGSVIKSGTAYYELNTDYLKSEIYKRCFVKRPTEDVIAAEGFPSGYIHFPRGLSREWYDQLCAEQRHLSAGADPMDSTGQTRYKWRKIRHANEAIDLMVYNLALYYHTNANRYLDKWDRFIRRASRFK